LHRHLAVPWLMHLLDELCLGRGNSVHRQDQNKSHPATS
jgi:hypothetical protein